MPEPFFLFFIGINNIVAGEMPFGWLVIRGRIIDQLVLYRYAFRKPAVFVYISSDLTFFNLQVIVYLLQQNIIQRQIEGNAGYQENNNGCKNIDAAISGK